MGIVERFGIITQPAAAPQSGYHDRAAVVIWPQDRERWISVGQDVTDLKGSESIDRFKVRPFDEADLAADQA